MTDRSRSRGRRRTTRTDRAVPAVGQLQCAQILLDHIRAIIALVEEAVESGESGDVPTNWATLVDEVLPRLNDMIRCLEDMIPAGQGRGC